ncbi:helix-turn-helix transcriptional regulator [Longispora sp. NPDC051575]|uniref:helix-turn-helix domain-containing protein n=1 Tax=Longispora sp. NPDC051575 TaxID=3154943 RepID=UPI0034273B83
MAGAVSSRESLGARLYRLRTQKGLTQKELAGDRYTAAYISTVEAERRTPSTDALAYFASRLGVSPAELSTGRPTELPVDLLISLAEADLAGKPGAYGRIRTRAAEHGLTRIEALALTGMGELDGADELLAAEPITVRVPLLTARARAARPAEAAYLLENALAQLHADGLPDPDAEAELRYALVHTYTDLGLTERAVEQADAAGALVGPTAEAAAVVERYLRTARTLRAQGRWADAEAAAERARAACRRREQRHSAAVGQWARGRLLARTGEHAAAVAELSHARELLGAAVAGELAEALWRVGRAEDAVAVAAEAEPAVAYRIKGLIARDAGDLAAAERELRAALGVSVGLETCTVARELGDLLRAGGREMEAIDVYRQGLEAVE